MFLSKKKSSNYILFELVPALRAKGLRVEIQVIGSKHCSFIQRLKDILV